MSQFFSASDAAALNRLLDEAIDMAPVQIESWLAGLPAQHQHLTQALRQMLQARQANAHATFMGAGPRLDGFLAGEFGDRAGNLVGPYRLIREIGRGGMGAVWLAERADGGLKRQVALKLPRLVWGEGLAARMARERDIGALLEHPNIARLYDAGVDAMGRPYLAMEYIAGQRLDAWCEARRLGIPERLRLFLQVARAVAYAHGRLVVHRDLKPSNVLVADDGQVHLLDFGIAKLLQEGSAPIDDPLTMDQGRMLTPHYASPEQLQGGTITVASDVYSLGVLLYELLTGSLPHAPARPGLAALEEAVLAGEPALASGRAKDKSLARALRGEVDSILGKALKREPEQRYATVDALAEDVQRYLSGEAVLARPDTRLYRLRKALRRHWVGASASTAVALAVLAGSGIAVFQARRAEHEAERTQSLKGLVTDLFQVDPGAGDDSEQVRAQAAEQLLSHGARLIESRFAGQADLQAELYGVVSGVYTDMGAHRLAGDFSKRQYELLQGLKAPTAERVASLLQLSSATLFDARADEAMRYALDAEHLAAGDRGLVYNALVMQLRCEGVGKDAMRAVPLRLKKIHALEADLDLRKNIWRAWALGVEAQIASRAEPKESARRFEPAIAAALAAEGADSFVAARLRIQAASHLFITGQAEAAERQVDAAFKALEHRGQAGQIYAAETRLEVMGMRCESGGGCNFALELPKAEVQLEKLRRWQAVLPAELLANAELTVAIWRSFAGDLMGVQGALDRTSAVAQNEKDIGTRLRWLLVAHTHANWIGNHRAAEEFMSEIHKIRMNTGRGGTAFEDADWIRLVAARIMGGRFDEAEAELSALMKRTVAPEYDCQCFGRLLAVSRFERGDERGAIRLYGATLDGPFESGFGNVDYLLDNGTRGIILCGQRRFDRGLELLYGAIELKSKRTLDYNPWLAWLRARAGLCEQWAGHTVEARHLADLSREALARQPEVGPYFRKPLTELDALLEKRS